MKKLLTFGLIILFVLQVSCFSLAETLTPTNLKSGDKLPAVELTKVSGESMSTTKLQYPLIVSVFTTWCTICKKELPQLNNLYNEANDKKITLNVLGVDAGESVNKVASYQRKQKLDFDLVVDTNLVLIKTLQIKGTPVILVFNRKGELTYQGNGIPNEWQKLIQ